MAHLFSVVVKLLAFKESATTFEPISEVELVEFAPRFELALSELVFEKH
mgnify:CR=1 FL=1